MKLNKDHVTHVYGEVLNKLMELEKDEMIVVAAALKSSVDSIYAIQSLSEKNLSKAPTAGGIQ